MATPQKSNSSRRRKWRAGAETEARRLGNTELDWNLAGGSLSRTRGGSSAASSSNVFHPSCEPCDLFGSPSVDSAVSSLTDTSTSPAKKKKYCKPPETRVIIEVNPVSALLAKHMKTSCPNCASGLKVKFTTTCLASSCRLECVNEGGCTYVDLVEPEGSNVPLDEDAGSELITRNTDYALNILYVISFIASGDGGTEAARLLGLLGLPNSTTMQSRSFGNIERELSPVIQGYTGEIIKDNLKKEVALLLADKVDENDNKLYDLWLEKKLPEPLWPRVDGCADMGWQQKGSGRKRNSKSGHALTIGMLTRKPIAMATCSKGCGFCKTWRTRHGIDEDPPEHKCFINHDGSSGSMEPIAVLKMYEDLYNQQVIVARFVADDDSSMKAKLKWSNEDHMLNTNTTTVPKIINSKGNLVSRPNHGGVPRHMPEPLFVADPNHRRKTLASALYALAALGKTSPKEQREQYDKRIKRLEMEAEAEAAGKTSSNKRKKKKSNTTKPKPFVAKPWNMTMSKMDCRRLSKNFAFMARTLQHKETDEEIIDAGKAVLEHHFDNHQHCGGWCRRKLALLKRQQQQEQQQAVDVDKKFYRDKTKDAPLYSKLQSIMARFTTLEALKEVGHNMDTCANESFNNTVSWLAPKNKVYCGTNSLKNRICIALGISTLGTMKYYQGLFQRMGITMHDDVRHYLQVKSSNRQKRLDKTKSKAYKLKRKRGEMEKIKKEAAEATVARAKRDGVYESGIGLTGGYIEVDDDDDGNKKPAAKVARDSSKPPCAACGGTDHQRTTSKKCGFYVGRKLKEVDKSVDEAGATAESKDMADEMDMMDSLGFDSDAGDSDDFFSAASEFS